MRAFTRLGETIIKEDLKKYHLRQWFRQWAFKEPERVLQHGQAMTERQLEQYEHKLLNPDI